MAITLASNTPVNNATGCPPTTPIEIELERLNSEPLEQLWTTQAQWNAGTHSSTTATSGGDLILSGSYATSGNWISQSIALTSVGYAGSAKISWTETIPGSCTVTVETRFNGGSWESCANGGDIPSISADDDLTGDTIEVRVSLTGPGTATPSVHDLTLDFDSIASELIEVIVDGTSCTTSNGKLGVQRYNKISGGSVVLDPSKSLCWAHPDTFDEMPETISVTVKYDDLTVSTFSFTVDTPFVFGSGVIQWRVTPHETSLIRFGPILQWVSRDVESWWTTFDLRWSVNEEPRARVTLEYIVGHIISSTFPGMFVVGELVEQIVPGQVLVEGFVGETVPGEFLAQGYKSTVYVGSYAIGEWIDSVFPGMFIVGARVEQICPGSYAVYGKNSYNKLHARVIDQDTYDALVDQGITIT